MVVPWDPTYTRPLNCAAKPAKPPRHRPTLELTHERVDDVPLLVGFLIKLRFPEILDRISRPIRSIKGSPTAGSSPSGSPTSSPRPTTASPTSRSGSTASRSHPRDPHRPAHSARRVRRRPPHLGPETPQRSGGLARAGSRPLARPLRGLCPAAVERVRLDATTSYGYHAIDDDGLMQLGHSKDHRPDLPQIKLMAAAAEPSWVVPGRRRPSRQCRRRPVVPAVVSAGPRRCWAGPGCSTPATARWRPWRRGPRSPPRGDFYLTRLPLTGEVAAQFAAWVEAALTGDAAAKLVEIRVEDELIGVGYEFERSQSAVVGQTAHTWSERVQIIRSEALAQSQAAALERRLEKAEAALRGLTPPPGPGRTQFTTGWELEQAVAAVLTEHEVEGLLEVSYRDAGDQPDQVRGAGAAAVPTAPRRPNGAFATRSPRCGATRRRSHDRWRGWAGRSR